MHVTVHMLLLHACYSTYVTVTCMLQYTCYCYMHVTVHMSCYSYMHVTVHMLLLHAFNTHVEIQLTCM